MTLDPLAKLRKELDAFQAKMPHKAERANRNKNHSVAFNIATNLVAGMLVGVGIGYYSDRYFGTRPILLIICILCGAAASFKMIWNEMKR